MNNQLYTLGTWVAKPGKEQEFIKLWTSFAAWTAKNFKGAGKGHLLQDENNPLRFVSFGPWDGPASVQHWRESEEFRTFVGDAGNLLDEFQPGNLRLVAESE